MVSEAFRTVYYFLHRNQKRLVEDKYVYLRLFKNKLMKRQVLQLKNKFHNIPGLGKDQKEQKKESSKKHSLFRSASLKIQIIFYPRTL